MHRQPRPMTKQHMISRTQMAKLQVRETLKRADEIQNDARKAERKAAHQCKSCFYFPRIGGAAITSQPCMSCGNPEQYGSTSTDALCMSCAKEFELCKHCGGDCEMRLRRGEWPEPKIKLTSESE